MTPFGASSAKTVKSPSGATAGKPKPVSAPSQNLALQVVELAVAQATRIADLEARPVPRSYVEIQDVELTVATAVLDFTNIPADYRHLRIVGLVRTDRPLTFDGVVMRFNADAGANYDWYWVKDRHTIATAVPTFETNDNVASADISLGHCPGDTAPINVFGDLEVLIPHYTSAFAYKSYSLLGGHILALARENIYCQRGHGHWRSTAPVNRIQLLPSVGPNFVPGTRFTLYGQG
jgi:hypothetical protein